MSHTRTESTHNKCFLDAAQHKTFHSFSVSQRVTHLVCKHPPSKHLRKQDDEYGTRKRAQMAILTDTQTLSTFVSPYSPTQMQKLCWHIDQNTHVQKCSSTLLTMNRLLTYTSSIKTRTWEKRSTPQLVGMRQAFQTSGDQVYVCKGIKEYYGRLIVKGDETSRRHFTLLIRTRNRTA